LYNLEIDEFSNKCYEILVEYAILTKDTELLNECFIELNKKFSNNLDFICLAIIEISKNKEFFSYDGFSDEFVSKLIEAAFLAEDKEFLIKFIDNTSIGESVFLPKILEFLKVLELKLPLVKILGKEKIMSYAVVDSLF